MAHTLSALKRIRQNKKRNEQNRAAKSKVRTLVKRVLAAVEKKDKETARTAYNKACSALDRAAQAGIMHSNSAARQKSRLSTKINRIA